MTPFFVRFFHVFNYLSRSDPAPKTFFNYLTNLVAVGMPVARHPPHGSVREELPHTALASGHNDKAQRSPRVPAQALFTHSPGSASGMRFAQASSPWPASFPPPPPQPAPCSKASLVLRSCPTSHGRSSSACVLGLPDAASKITGGNHGISRFPRGASPYVLGVSDRAGSEQISRYRSVPYCLPLVVQRRHPELGGLHGSIPGPHVPLSTLQPRHYCRRRMTRGQCGSLCLHRMTLSFTTLHRS